MGIRATKDIIYPSRKRLLPTMKAKESLPKQLLRLGQENPTTYERICTNLLDMGILSTNETGNYTLQRKACPKGNALGELEGSELYIVSNSIANRLSRVSDGLQVISHGTYEIPEDIRGRDLMILREKFFEKRKKIKETLLQREYLSEASEGNFSVISKTSKGKRRIQFIPSWEGIFFTRWDDAYQFKECLDAFLTNVGRDKDLRVVEEK